MARRRKPRPTPEQLAEQAAARRAEARRQSFASIGLAEDAADLLQNQAVTVEPVTRADATTGERGNDKRARRDDVFEALLRRGRITARSSEEDRREDGRRAAALNAARRLERDMLIRRGEGGNAGEPTARVDESSPAVRPRWVVVMVEAGERVDAALSRVGHRDATLLCELIQPSRIITAEAERWRAVVRLMTGERHRNAQAARVRAACDNLAAGYADIDVSAPGSARGGARRW
jgi:hypothetical protein